MVEMREDIIVDIKSLFDGVGFKLFMNTMKSVDKAMLKIEQNTKRLTNNLRTVFGLKGIDTVRQKQATEGMKRRYDALQEQLKPLGAEVRKSLLNIVKPSLTAEQAAEGIINKQKELREMSKDMKKTLESAGIKRLTKSHVGWNKVMGMSVGELNEWNKSGKLGATNTGNLANKVRLATHGLRGFRMEMLGVMFFGMAMQRMFSRMLKPATEVMGIMDLWGVTMQVVFLPTMEDLQPYLMNFMEWLRDLPKWAKKGIGAFALVGLAIGTMLMLTGTFALGIGSILQMHLGKMFLLFGKLNLLFIGLGLIVGGFFMVFKGKMEGIGIIIMGVGVVMLMFMTWWALIPLAVGAAVYLVIKHWKKLQVYALGFVRLIFEHLRDLPVIGGFLTKAFNLDEAIQNVNDAQNMMLDDIEAGMKQDDGALEKGMSIMGETVMNGFEGFTTTTEEGMGDMSTSVSNGMDMMYGNFQSGYDKELTATTSFVDDMNTEFAKINYGAEKAEKAYKSLSEAGRGGGQAAAAAYAATPHGRGSYEVTTATGERVTRYHDFISRPGQAPFSVNPNDTLVGFKGKSPFGGGGVNITQNISVTGSLLNEVERLIKDNNVSLVDDVRRLVGV